MAINSTNDGSLSLISSEVNITNGYANFTQFGVSNMATSLVLEYSIKLPSGINAALFDPKTILGQAINVTSPDLSCEQSGDKIIVEVNEMFNLTIALTDALSGAVIQDITFNVRVLFASSF